MLSEIEVESRTGFDDGFIASRLFLKIDVNASWFGLETIVDASRLRSKTVLFEDRFRCRLILNTLCFNCCYRLCSIKQNML